MMNGTWTMRAAGGLLVLAAVAAGCTWTTPSGGGKGDAASTAAPAPQAVGPTIYDLDLPLTDDQGATLRLADLRGRTIVASMIYTSCDSVCPRVTQDMKGIERQLREAGERDVTFVLFSLDPGRDTPEALRQYAETWHLDRSHWRLFAMPEESVRDLAAVLDVKYAFEDDGEIAHSALIVLIDRNGVVQHRQVGLTEKPTALVEAIRRART